MNDQHNDFITQDGPITPDDPRLTAFALGELEAAEADAVEAQVADSAELQAAVAEIRAAAELLTDQLQAEPAAALADSQREAIQGQIAIESQIANHSNSADTAGAPRDRPGRPGFRWAMPLALAASLAIVVTAGSYVLPGLSRSRELTYSDKLALLEQRPDEAPIDGASHRMKREAEADTNGARGVTISAPLASVADDRGKLDRSMQAHPAPARSVGGSGAKASDSSVAPRGRDSNAPAEQYYTGGIVAEVDGQQRRRLRGGRRRAGITPLPRIEQPKPGEVSYDDAEPLGQRLTLLMNERHIAPGNAESYDAVSDNPFMRVGDAPLSTFSIDVDTASYANVRRFLKGGRLPPAGAVRIEELINYFDYDYPQPDGEHPFSVSVEVAGCPWTPEHRLARVGLKGYEVDDADRPPANLVFLLDVSGSMNVYNKLPLVKQALRMLVDELSGDDYISMVVYAGSSGLVLPPTPCQDEAAISDAIDRLSAGGSTNGGAGIELAYNTAVGNFIEGGINRVILATDGDFNVGITNQGSLVRLIEEKAQEGVFLSVLGFGMGNLKDSTLEKLADKGNGHYAYIDDLDEAEKVLVTQMGGTLVTIAKDVKIQIEFNPAKVAAYRLIGYENRKLRARDFNDDTKDAGEIGAGHTVTALYEIVPAGMDFPGEGHVDALKYQRPKQPVEHGNVDPEDDIDVDSELVPSAELLTVKLRYKEPDEDVSQLIEVAVVDDEATYAEASDPFALATSVAGFGMMLRGSAHCGDWTYQDVLSNAQTALGEDVHGYRKELCDLVQQAIAIQEVHGR